MIGGRSVAVSSIITMAKFLKNGGELLQGKVTVLDDGRQLPGVDTGFLLLRVQQRVWVLGLDAQMFEYCLQVFDDRRDLFKIWARYPGALVERVRGIRNDADRGGGCALSGHAHVLRGPAEAAANIPRKGMKKKRRSA